MKKAIKQWKFQEYLRDYEKCSIILFLDTSKLGYINTEEIKSQFRKWDNNLERKKEFSDIKVSYIKNSLYRKVLYEKQNTHLLPCLHGPILKLCINVDSNFKMFFNLTNWLQKNREYVLLGGIWKDQIITLKVLESISAFSHINLIQSLNKEVKKLHQLISFPVSSIALINRHKNA